jgi:DNA polymerase IV
VLLEQDDPVATARELKEAIRAEVGLVASMGLATSKLVSKIASDHGKPDGFVVVPAGQEAAFLAPMPVRRLWGVGPKTAERLEGRGITTIGALATADLAGLAESFGARQARALMQRARGEDQSPIEVSRELKSISDEITFARDERNARLLWRVLGEQCHNCAARLGRRGLMTRTITIKLRFGDFRTITRSHSLAVPTNDEAVIRAAVASLMRQAWAADRRPLRLVGVRVSGFSVEAPYVQLPMFIR